ncbi:hypothetical protein OGATHE_003741 [Ogataea polymorpha]|uniref:Uncharacterized protein n=1 Tax=Ogataea polymorpha TaxID=460523 RepID=A0A9P8T4J3_9ASCO|nr:hypothetical protein OGATHE_003741 [Ogataea polymorpha]
MIFSFSRSKRLRWGRASSLLRLRPPTSSSESLARSSNWGSSSTSSSSSSSMATNASYADFWLWSSLSEEPSSKQATICDPNRLSRFHGRCPSKMYMRRVSFIWGSVVDDSGVIGTPDGSSSSTCCNTSISKKLSRSTIAPQPTTSTLDMPSSSLEYLVFRSLYPTTGINWNTMRCRLRRTHSILAAQIASTFKHETNMTSLQVEWVREVVLISSKALENSPGVNIIVT